MAPLPRNAIARQVRRVVRQQVANLVRNALHRPRRGRGRGAGAAARGPRSPPAGGRHRDNIAPVQIDSDSDSSRDAEDQAAQRGLPALPDACLAPNRIRVTSPRHCNTHGCTVIPRVVLEEEGANVVAAYCCARHGWRNFLTWEDSPCCYSSPTPSPPRSPPRAPATPPNSPVPPNTPTPVEAPSEFLIQGTIAARRGAPPFYLSAGGSSSTSVAAPPGFAHPEPAFAPPSPTPTRAAGLYGRTTAAAAANARPGLKRRIIPTGHVPAETRAGAKARRPPPSGEGEA
ncbi:unnamed protein product [Urochloa humidicola]